MATEQSFDLDYSVPDEWTRVTVRSAGGTSWQMPTCEWLNDYDRSGEWTLEHYEFRADCAIDTFAMSDPDTAFEFKMRWG